MELREGRYVVPKESLEVRAATTAELWEERLSAALPLLAPHPADPTP